MAKARDSDPPLNTFVVRFWPGQGKNHWRGRVLHIQSGESATFTDAGTLVSFMERWVCLKERHEETERDT